MTSLLILPKFFSLFSEIANHLLKEDEGSLRLDLNFTDDKYPIFYSSKKRRMDEGEKRKREKEQMWNAG